MSQLNGRSVSDVAANFILQASYTTETFLPYWGVSVRVALPTSPACSNVTFTVSAVVNCIVKLQLSQPDV